MSAPATVAEKPTGTPTTTIAERPGWDLPGWSMLGIGLALLLGGIAAFALGLVFTVVWLVVTGVVLFVLSLPALMG
ncbi:MAG: SPFH domain-containing protein, partial [Rhodococcus sp. (in: high G+C Gram-positive bacteria)]